MRGLGPDPRAVDRVRREVGHPDHGDQVEPVQHRPEPVGPHDRVRHPRGPLGAAARGGLRADHPDRHRADRAGDHLRTGAARWRSTGGGCPLLELIGEVDRHRRVLRLGPDRHGREPAGRHQEPGGLRVPGSAGPAHGPLRPGGPDPRAGPGPREGPTRAALRRAGVRRPVVLAPQGGPRRLRGREPASTSPATCGCAASCPAAASWPGRRSDVGLYDYALATYEAADRFRHQDAEGFVRLWGLGVATWAARQVNRQRRR